MSTENLEGHPEKLDEANSGYYSRKDNHTSKNDIFEESSILFFHKRLPPLRGALWAMQVKLELTPYPPER